MSEAKQAEVVVAAMPPDVRRWPNAPSKTFTYRFADSPIPGKRNMIGMPTYENRIEVRCEIGMQMRNKFIQVAAIALTFAYAAFIVGLYATEPRTFKEVATSAEVATGTYEIDREKFNSALELFRREQFRAARDEWLRADPALRNAQTQFYVAYAFYREGWGRVYYDQELMKRGLEAVNRAIAVAPIGSIAVEDPNLQIHTAAELKAELEQASERSLSDFNPFKVLRPRK